MVLGTKLGSRAKIEALKKQLAQERARLKEARQHIVNLLGEKRVAEVVVLDQTAGGDGGQELKLKFLEYAADGRALAPRIITVSGEEVYFDALVILFKPEDVMQDKAASIHLFRRVFTDKTRPEEGETLSRLDTLDIPEAYRSPDLPVDVQQKAWEDLRQLVEDENYRTRRGVRTVFGQAVYKKLQKGIIYTLKVQNNGGLLIEEKPVPEILREP
jgi:hypothetical protein